MTKRQQEWVNQLHQTLNKISGKYWCIAVTELLAREKSTSVLAAVEPHILIVERAQALHSSKQNIWKILFYMQVSEEFCHSIKMS